MRFARCRLIHSLFPPPPLRSLKREDPRRGRCIYTHARTHTHTHNTGTRRNTHTLSNVSESTPRAALTHRRAHAPTHAPTHPRTHAPTHPRARAHTHTHYQTAADQRRGRRCALFLRGRTAYYVDQVLHTYRHTHHTRTAHTRVPCGSGITHIHAHARNTHTSNC